MSKKNLPLEEIAQKYSKGMSTEALTKEYGCTDTMVAYARRKYGVPSRPVGSSNRKYSLNHDYFDRIDTEEKAYFLGLLGSDGYVASRNSQIELGLSGEEDKYLLVSFLKAVGSDAPVKEHKTNYPNAKTPYRAGVCSAKMKNDLIRHGVTPIKSLTYQFNMNLRPDLVRHYVRGYFDGDGSCSYKKDGSFLLSITSSPQFIVTISQIIKDELSLNCTLDTKDTSKAHSIKIGGNFVCFLFLHWIYHDCTISMNRKRAKYDLCRQIVEDKLKNKNSFYNISHFKRVMNHAKQCANILAIEFDMTQYNGLSSTPEQQSEIVTLYSRGFGIRRLSRHFDKSNSFIKNALIRNGVEMRPRYVKGFKLKTSRLSVS